MSHVVKTMPYVVENVDNLIKDAELAEQRFNFFYPAATSTTYFFKYYNFTCLTSGSPYYYDLFRQVQKEIRDFVGSDDRLWYQCWFNWHRPDQVLDWHEHHGCVAHGYISIRPHDTVTEFEDFSVKNEVGKLYLGKANKRHRVKVVTPFDTPRLTIAFDVVSEELFQDLYKQHGNVDVNLSHLPVY